MSKYKTTLKTRAFLYLELKKASALYAQGLSLDDIKRKALEENIFLFNTEQRIRDVALTIIDRLNALDNNLIKMVAGGSLETSKQVNLYSILKTDRLFLEFMLEVYREKYILKDFLITGRDFGVFFQRKSEQSEQVAAWTDYTFYKLQQVHKRVLIEAGFARKKKKDIEIVKPIIEKELKEHLTKKGDYLFLKAMTGDI